MAGDWVKVEKSTARKPEVLRLASILGITRRESFSLCVEFWFWCDDQLSECHACGVTEKMIDEVVGVTGFASALIEVGWLQARNGSLAIPNFDRHLSESAKKRALSGKRQQKKRHADVTPMSRNERDKSVTREEKRREEITYKPKSSQSASSSHKTSDDSRAFSGPAKQTRQLQSEGEYGDQFETFWNAYGKKTGRGYAQGAWLNATSVCDPETIIQAAINQTSLYVECGLQMGDMKAPDRWLGGEHWGDDLKTLRETITRGAKSKPPATISECPI